MSADNDNKIMANSPVKDFQQIYEIIQLHRQKVASTIDYEGIMMIWEVGAFISNKLKCADWGDGVVRQLSEYIRTQDPTTRGWSYRTIYKMVQFYDIYSTPEFAELVNSLNIQQHVIEEFVPMKLAQIVPLQMAQLPANEFVPFQMAQMPSVLFSTGWTNHMTIMSRLKTHSERLFYMLYAGHEHLKISELERAIKTNVMTSLLGSKDVQSEKMLQTYPQSQVLFKDTAYLDFLGLPQRYKESRLRKGIIQHMKEFILELGKDFLFIDQEHCVKVGGKTFKIDLLFYHRQLQCMVAFELKTTEFQPSYQGQLEFYLEALDQEERRSNENPTIGIILCKESDPEIVRFALNRSMSPMMVVQYKEQLKVGGVIQRSLVEYCDYISKKL